MLADSLRHNLRGLLSFSGRQPRGLFWPYAITVFVTGTVAHMMLMIPILNDMMGRMGEYLRDHPEGLPPLAPGQSLPPELLPGFEAMFAPMIFITIATTLLYAAATVRRLHDRDLAGWWALLPLGPQVVGLMFGPAALQSATRAVAHQAPLQPFLTLNGVAFWVAFVTIVVLLAGEGTPGPNRFGDPLVIDRS